MTDLGTKPPYRGSNQPEETDSALSEKQKWTLSHRQADQIIFSTKNHKPIAALYWHPDFADQTEVDLMVAMLKLITESEPTPESSGTTTPEATPYPPNQA